MNCDPRPFDTHPGCDRAEIAAKLAALSHPARIEILQHLAGVDACCCKEVVQRFDLAQSTVSQHLKVLVDAGLVRLTPERRRSRYEVDRAALEALSRSVSGLLVSCCAAPAGTPAE
ncbi:metalloregulator ArsR/SmtB family transcription factor [Mesorhizobium sp. CAU 1741]|uniref:ArsR/SmtB family transcription factor n=1 Tax=Mesorhizobium sp. CAU 1741 TaxID=3140366 RepID=UPI00325AF872